MVTVCELNEDLESIRLDGLGSVTVASFLGSLERIYDRGGGVRSEVGVQPDSLASVYGLLKGGVTAYNVLQAQLIITKRLEGLAVSVKEQSRGIQGRGKVSAPRPALAKNLAAVSRDGRGPARGPQLESRNRTSKGN